MYKQINRYSFWLWLCRLAYKKLNTPVGKMLVGIPANRDPDAVCTLYAPRKRVVGDMEANCTGDGHYLCNECAFYKLKKNK